MTRKLTLIIAVLAVAVASAAPQKQKWVDPYRRGVEAFNHGQWLEVISNMSQAIGFDAKQDANKRAEGVFTEPYFPYFYMGVAHLKMNDLDGAEKYFKRARDPKSGALSPQFANDLKKYEADLQTARDAATAKKAAPATPPPVVSNPPPPVPQPQPTTPANAANTANTGGGTSTSNRGAEPPPTPPPHPETAPVKPPATAGRSAAPPPAPAPSKTPPTRDAVAAFLKGDVDQAVKLLEPAVDDRAYDANARADMHAWLGVAYAHQALLATGAEEGRLTGLATAEFRMAFSSKPGLQLPAKIVSPKILALFDAAKARK